MSRLGVKDAMKAKFKTNRSKLFSVLMQNKTEPR